VFYIFLPLFIASCTFNLGTVHQEIINHIVISSFDINSEEGKVRKVLKVEPTPDGNGRFFNLSM